MTNSKNGKKPTSSGSSTSLSGDSSILKTFFIDELKDIYRAEKHLVKTLPKMEKAATTRELKEAINEHLEITKTHVFRLEDVLVY